MYLCVCLLPEIEEALGLKLTDVQTDSRKRKVSQSDHTQIEKLGLFSIALSCFIGFSRLSLWFHFKLPVTDNGHQLHDTSVHSNGSGAGVLWWTKHVET